MSLIRNVSWIFGANLIVSFSKWLILVIIARVLTPEDVGVYSLALAVGAPITLFANMKLRSLYITEEKNNFRDYISARNILSGFSFLVLLLVALFIYPSYFYMITLVGIIKLLDLKSDIYYALPHKEEDIDLIGKLMIWKHLTTLIAFVFVISITKNLVLSLTIQLLSQMIFLFIIERKYIEKKYSFKENNSSNENIKKVILIGLPLGFVQMMYSFNVSYPRYLLEFVESAEVLGYYSAIAYILTLGTLLINAVSQNFLPLLSQKLKMKQYKKFKRYVLYNLPLFFAVLGIIIISLSIAFGDVFLSIIYGKAYAEYADLLILMSISLTINFFSANFDNALLAMRYISIQPKIAVIILIVNLFAGYFLITNYGVYGVAFTIITTHSIQTILKGLFVVIRLNTYQE